MAFALDRGTSVGDYVILEELGRGAMGVVFSAYDEALKREVAIKILHPLRKSDDEFSRRQQRLTWEAQATAQLSHPNVVRIFGFGQFKGQKYFAMELLRGGTLRRWMEATRRPWREVVALFVEVARGLGAAHAAGFIHRDFKPDNVLLDEEGRPRIVDFGLVRKRDSSGADAQGDFSQPGLAQGRGPDLPAPNQGISLTGAWVGTPAYMAPEQFRDELVDERADQFAFCVTLYEALYGARPFAGNSRMDIAANVAQGKVLDPPRGSDVPGWVRRVVLKGLSVSAEDRFESMGELRRALERDPALIRRRWIVGAALALLAAGSAAAVQESSARRRRELDVRIARLESEYQSAVGAARAAAAAATAARHAVLAMFDRGERDEGNRGWPDVLAKLGEAEGAFERAEEALRAEWDLDRERPGLGDRLVDLVLERAFFAEEDGRDADAAKRIGELAAIDVGGRGMARWQQPGSVALRGLDPSWRVTLQMLVRGPEWSWKVQPATWPAPPASGTVSLPVGSYRLLVTMAGERTYFFPFRVVRGRALVLDLAEVEHVAVPGGFRLIPGGPTLVGERDEAMRRGFCDTVPLHEVTLHSFAIAEDETTNEQWMAYLDSLGTREREARRPLVSTVQGYLELRSVGRGWTLSMRPTRRLYEAQGWKIRYQGRDRLAEQDWRRFPVAGVGADDAKAYVAWLAASGRVPKARLCTEVEWERAARGADGRPYPMGEHLGASQANFDQTYGRVTDAFGPDQVGVHPDSNSPFGVSDLAGNVWEIVLPSFGHEPFVLRGGGYFHDDASARSSNRHVIDSSARAPYVGVRVCADVP